MQKELLYLEELYLSEKELVKKYTSDTLPNSPKTGYEKEWSQAYERADMLMKIMKLIQREMKALCKTDKCRLEYIIDKLLNESATAHICGTVDSAEVTIVDGIERKIIATLKTRIALGDCLLIDEFHFY